MSKPFFSVIIATHNRAQFISTTLKSVLGQEFTDYEVIVVDDGSTDDTLEVLRDFPWVKVLPRENGGPGAARNFGVGASAGEYIAFLDSDDIWFPWTLATFARVIEQSGRPGLLSAKLQMFRDEEELLAVKREPPRADVFKDYFKAGRKGYFVSAGMMVVKKSLFDEAEGFTERRIYAEDCDLALRLGLAKGFAQIQSPVTFGYRQHGASARRNRALIYQGTLNLVLSERRGAYPGGSARRADRLRLITLHVRPFSVECIRAGEHSMGWALYLKTFAWHVRMGRWKYLFGLPALSLLRAFGFWAGGDDPGAVATPVRGRPNAVSDLQ